jgi:nitrogenase molybdenum-iron protein beta chain
VDAVIEEEEAYAFYLLDQAADLTSSYSAAMPVAIVANSAQATKLTRFLANEVGYTPTVVIVNDNPPQEYRKDIVKGITGLESGFKPNVEFEIDSYRIREILKKSNYRLLLASSHEKWYAADQKVGHLTVTFPSGDRMIITRSYAGYAGGVALMEDILSKFLVPY